MLKIGSFTSDGIYTVQN